MRLDTFKDWQEFARIINARSKALTESVHAKGWQLAASVGIPHCLCCLHNASIDDNMTGWCAGNPQRLKVAKRANHILNDWEASRKAERIIRKAWNQMAKKNGFCCD